MGGLFSKSKKAPPSRVTEQDKAVLQLKQQRDKLKQYQKKILVQLEKERDVARQLLRDGKKDKAKLLLRKKKFQEGLLTKTDGQLDNIEQLVHDLEFAQVEAKVLEGLKTGNASLKKMHEIMSIEDVERIMDETQASVEYQNEIDALLAGGLTEQDEEDVLAELDTIIEDSIPSVETADKNITLPDVPEDELLQPEKERQKTRKQEPMLAS